MTTHTPVTLRLSIVQSPPGVRWGVQLGRDGLLAPIESTRDRVVFEIPLSIGPNARGVVQLRGDAIQGPPAARFVYVNSGKRAADVMSGWDRRAKVPLASIDVDALRGARDHVVLFEGAIQGTARDGGPTCAGVALIGGSWTLRVDGVEA